MYLGAGLQGTVQRGTKRARTDGEDTDESQLKRGGPPAPLSLISRSARQKIWNGKSEEERLKKCEEERLKKC